MCNDLMYNAPKCCDQMCYYSMFNDQMYNDPISNDPMCNYQMTAPGSTVQILGMTGLYQVPYIFLSNFVQFD